MFTMTFAKPFDEVPSDVRERLQSLLARIAQSLDTMPRTGVTWKSISVGGLVLPRWRFQYRVDVKKESLVVEDAKIRESP